MSNRHERVKLLFSTIAHYHRGKSEAYSRKITAMNDADMGETYQGLFQVIGHQREMIAGINSSSEDELKPLEEQLETLFFHMGLHTIYRAEANRLYALKTTASITNASVHKITKKLEEVFQSVSIPNTLLQNLGDYQSFADFFLKCEFYGEKTS